MRDIDQNVPFFSNTKDDTHCFQASLRMVLGFFEPTHEYTWDQLDHISAKIDGLWTWPTAAMIWLHEHGYAVQNIELFDYQTFILAPERYLSERYGEEVARAQIAHSDISHELAMAKQYTQTLATDLRAPTIKDIRKILQQGSLGICNVNACALGDRQGYAGHFVVVKGYDDTSLILHDPGLPPRQNMRVSFEKFACAWEYPDEKATALVAIRKK